MSGLLPVQSGQRTELVGVDRKREFARSMNVENCASNRFRAEWLPDSSGYIVREPSEDGRQTQTRHLRFSIR